jgi:hypothetical protein
MTERTIVRLAAAAVAVSLVGALASACSNKAVQQFNDAPRTSEQNSAPAEVIAMPDGFSNLASKCDGPNRVYVVFHEDSAYGSVAVVPNDPRCTSSTH